MGYIKNTTGEYTTGFVGLIVATLILTFIVALIGKGVRKKNGVKNMNDESLAN